MTISKNSEFLDPDRNSDSLPVLPWMSFYPYLSIIRCNALRVFTSKPPTRVYREIEKELEADKTQENRAMKVALLRYTCMLEVHLLSQYPLAMYGRFPLQEKREYELLVNNLCETIFGFHGPDSPIVRCFLELYRKHATT